jgi:hypothetical protein
MPKSTLLIIAVSVFLHSSAQDKKSFDLSRKFHKDSVVKSYGDLFKELSLKHPGFYRYQSRETMNAYIDSTFQSIKNDSVSGWEIYRKMKPVVSKIGCLHTGLTLSQKHEQLLDSFPNLLPFQLYFYDDKAYIIKNVSADRSIQPGTQITHINGRSMEELLQIMLPAIPSDGYNLTMKFRALHHDFARWYRSMVEQAPLFSITIVRNGKPETVSVAAVAKKQVSGNGFLEEVQHQKQLEFGITDSIAILSVHSFAKTDIKSGDQRFKKFMQSTFRSLKDNNINNLVIDLRYNTGGTDANAAYFSKYFFNDTYRYWDRIEVTEPIAKEIKGKYKLFFKKPIHTDSMWLWRKTWVTKEFNFYQPQQPAKNNFTGNVYILINGFCMSSCADLAAVLSKNPKVLFIGEETGGCYQGNNSGMMPESETMGGFTLTVPLQKYHTAVDPSVNFGRGTLPDHGITPTVDDVINDRDVVMWYAQTLIRIASATHQ